MDALYFPFIEVPDTPSLTPVLLYWDSLGTIMPRSLNRPLSAHLRDLIDCELVDPVDPEQYVDHISEYSALFAETVLRLVDERTPVRDPVTGETLKHPGTGEPFRVRIHRSKAATALWWDLDAYGLTGRTDGAWTEVLASFAFLISRTSRYSSHGYKKYRPNR